MSGTESCMSPRESGIYITKHAKHVFVREDAIPKMVLDLYNAMERDELRKCSITEHETFPANLTQFDSLNYILLLDTLNFCFWTPSQTIRWNIRYRDVAYTGYFALCAAIKNACDKGIRVFDPKVYSQFTLEDVKKIFEGENGIYPPLLDERLKCLHEVGTTLLAKYDGSFEKFILEAKCSAETLLKSIVEDFPCFNDSSTYMGKQVAIHKRAQILVGDIWGLYYGKGISEFADIDTITMFADYRVPQVLVEYGIMEYSEELLTILRKDEILKHNSELEVEIRGCSIRAVDLVVQNLHKFMAEENRKCYPHCNAITVDNYLWTYRRKHAERLEAIPYHKTYSIYY